MTHDLVVASHGGTGVGDGCREQRPGRCRVGRIRAVQETSINEVRPFELLAREVANCAAQISRSLGAAPRLFSPGAHAMLD